MTLATWESPFAWCASNSRSGYGKYQESAATCCARSQNRTKSLIIGRLLFNVIDDQDWIRMFLQLQFEAESFNAFVQRESAVGFGGCGAGAWLLLWIGGVGVQVAARRPRHCK